MSADFGKQRKYYKGEFCPAKQTTFILTATMQFFLFDTSFKSDRLNTLS